VAHDALHSKSYRRRDAGPAFASFLERDAYREQRRRGRRRTIAISVALHVLAAAVILFLSVWDVEELWAPSVPVTMFGRLPAPGEDVRRALKSATPNATPAPATKSSP
jgi:hypothetical protein